MAKTYYEKLKDPRWQKKRLEVMQNSEFSCEICGDSESPLNVHHKEYFKNLDPWDYDNSQLACICENCHEDFHHNIDVLKLVCSMLSMHGNDSRIEISALIAGYIGEDLTSFIRASKDQYYPFLEEIFKSGISAKKKVTNKLIGRGFKDG